MPSTSFTRLIAAPVAACAACAAIAAGGATAHATPAAAPAQTRLAIVEQAHGAFTRPDYRSHRLTTVEPRRPITGGETVLPVLAETVADDRRWLRVRLPGRPNGRSGWIVAHLTRYAQTPWRVQVATDRRRVTVLHAGRTARTFRAIVGTSWTPTPHGRFFVEESVRLNPSLVGAPYALALSARSDVLDQFAGGPGQIALHGLGNVGGVLGTAASHGCIRLNLAAISWLAARIGPGTPVTISAGADR